LTVLGQAIKPHRIVYNGDTGIFFNKQQEIILLGIVKTQKSQEQEIKQLYIYKDNCDNQLKAEQKANADLNKLFTEMEGEANRLKDKYNNEVIEHAKTKEKLEVIIESVDWNEAAKDLLARKEEWGNLSFFEQSDWKCNYFGLPSEKFKEVTWSIL
jgi:hypothetical protein